MEKIKAHLGSLIIAFTIIASVIILANTYQNRNRSNDLINVTGLGKKDFTSDLITWNGTFSKKRMELDAAFEALKKDKETIKKYLTDKGVKENEILFSSVDIDKQFTNNYDKEGNRSSVFTGYKLSQSVDIESKDVALIENVSRDITQLIEVGIEVYSNNPQYYYTGLAELKIEMIAAATEDARIRAEKIAENSGASLGALRYARMGIFQIIGQNSNEDYSWGGSFNTSSKMKTATITMKLQFGIQ